MNAGTRPGRASEDRLGQHQAGIGSRPFALLLVQVFFVGALVGIERTLLPLLARSEFGIASATETLAFITTFGIGKAVMNAVAGRLADRIGARPVLIAGWLIALPIPLALATAPSWEWILAVNLLLGVQQGMCWSTSIFMKIDLVAQRQRGVAIGLNEFAGYAGTALLAYATGAIAAASGNRSLPFLLGEAIAVGGLVLALRANERPLRMRTASSEAARLPRATLAMLAQAGFVTKLVDVVAWGLLPVYFSQRGVSLLAVSALAAAYPASWSLLQPISGRVSDAIGRRAPILAGLLVQAAALVLIARVGSFELWLATVAMLGVGTALVYPVLIAAVADAAPARVRASAVGQYRLWRDLGFVVGGISIGALADAVGTPTTLSLLGVLALVAAGVLGRVTSLDRLVASR